MFSFEFCQFFKNIYFAESPRTATSSISAGYIAEFPKLEVKKIPWIQAKSSVFTDFLVEKYINLLDLLFSKYLFSKYLLFSLTSQTNIEQVPFLLKIQANKSHNTTIIFLKLFFSKCLKRPKKSSMNKTM